ncbi:MAG: hypothetical protein WBG90_11255, partial [Saonia sp.]
MKKLALLIGLLFSFSIFSQGSASKNDIIFTTNGELIQAKVVKVTDDTVSFNYPGETVINEMKSAGLEKIVFASGRTQNFNSKKAIASSSSLSLADNVDTPAIPSEEIYVLPSYEENTLAVIPFSYMRNNTYNKNLSSEVTAFVINFMASKAPLTTIETQSMPKTIKKLVDNGISHKRLGEASAEELRTIVGTQYILRASIEETTGDSTASVTEEDKKGTEVVTRINLKLYDPENNVEKYEANFSDGQFLQKDSNGYLKRDGNWKAPMEYVL